ncbi:hypothetical protein SCOCK_50061 [Actinacidiphila cocklensis]|uniref:Uncharacterized protein n=1 Tax=Actinacidiphila cocklensis TaxID=887465 RepID=A0A9W4GVS3_9ACTN|nr:hypothetical protein SCOCK_50061 [Actinacidiphila cocklensis]
MGRHGPQPLRLLGPDAVLVQPGRQEASAHRCGAVRQHQAHRGVRAPGGRPGVLPLRFFRLVGLPRRDLRGRRPDLARSQDRRAGPAGAHLDQQRVVRTGIAAAGAPDVRPVRAMTLESALPEGWGKPARESMSGRVSG